MNKDVLVIAKKEENIKRIKTIFELIGYNFFIADDINSAFRVIEKFIPLAIIIVEEDEETTSIYVREIKRYSPLLPIIILMNEKNHQKREKYLNEVHEVIEYPWTEIMLAETLNILEIKKIKSLKVKDSYEKKISKNLTHIFMISFGVMFISIILLKLTPSKKNENKVITHHEFKIPSKNISGFFERQNYYYVYDWAIQSFYVSDRKDGSLINIKNFFTPYIITSIKEGGSSFFFALTDNNEIKKILKDEKFRELYTLSGYKNIADICYDGMYIWVLNETNIMKILDSEKNEIIERYNLPDEIIGANHLSCDNDKLFYYKEPNIYIASLKNPIKIEKKITTKHRILSLNSVNGKTFFIAHLSGNSYIEELKTPNY